MAKISIIFHGKLGNQCCFQHYIFMEISKFAAAGTIGNDVFIGRYNPVSKITQCVANKNGKTLYLQENGRIKNVILESHRAPKTREKKSRKKPGISRKIYENNFSRKKTGISRIINLEN